MTPLRQLAIGSLLAGVFASGVAAAQPNIVFVTADDLGWSDTSNSRTNLGHPSDYYETPTLDRLAAEGMSFTNAYTSGPSCAPTRAALLTGQYAPRPTNNVYAVTSLDRIPDSLLVGADQGLPTGTDAIPARAFTYAEMLQRAGYRTGHFGKFHVTETGASGAALIVSDHGFHANFGGTTLGNPGRYHARGEAYGAEIGPELDAFAAVYSQEYVDANIKPFSNGASASAIDALVGTEKHVSDAMTDAALWFMEREKHGPFLVQFNPYAVHTPIGDAQARADLLAKYRGKPPGAEDANASFASLLEGMDQNLARMIHYLETTDDPRNPGRKLHENTIVFFYSDNGGRQPQSNNGPLKGEKGLLDEGGIRVPLVAWSGAPSLVDGGAINDTPVASIDFYKTFASLAGAGSPDGVVLDGEDLTGILADRDQVLGREALFWHYPGNNKHRTQQPQSVVRKGDWKLLFSYEDQSYELYNLAEDLGETTNLAGAHPEKVAELGMALMAWLDRVDAPLATLRDGRMVIDVSGPIYANGAISIHDGPLTIGPGDEAPLLLGGILNLADLDANARVDAADWRIFRQNHGADLAGLIALEAFRRGDLDGDFDNDPQDFLRFKRAYDAANGAGALETLAAANEPSGSASIRSLGRRSAAILLLLGAAVPAAGQVADFDPARFANAIKRFEKEDARRNPARGGTVIVGSSSVRRLDAAAVFPGVDLIQRGFGGAHISDINHYAEQLVLKHEPSRVIFFCGGNDLWVGHSIEEVAEDFNEFTEKLFDRSPECRLIVLAIRPSSRRRRLIPTVLEMNGVLEEVAASHPRITFLRGSCDRFLDGEGNPIRSMYVDDMQHMNEEGYRVWTEIVMPHLADAAPESLDEPSAEDRQ